MPKNNPIKSEQPAAAPQGNTMTTYRFVGSSAFIGGKALDTLGQSIDLEPSVAEPGILNNIALIPEDIFKDVGFTPEELKAHPTPEFQQVAPTMFQQKLKAAHQALDAYRVSLRNPPSVQ